MEIRFHLASGATQLVATIEGISGSQGEWLMERIREDVRQLDDANKEQDAGTG